MRHVMENGSYSGCQREREKERVTDASWKNDRQRGQSDVNILDY